MSKKFGNQARRQERRRRREEERKRKKEAARAARSAGAPESTCNPAASEQAMGIDDFAARIIERARHLQPGASIDYDSNSAQIRVGGVGGVGDVLNLRRLHREFVGPAIMDRNGLIETLARGIAMKPADMAPPSTFAEARGRLYPIVAPRIEVDSLSTASGSAATGPLGGHLSVGLVWDAGEHVIHIKNWMLRKWGVEFEAAKAVAEENLRRDLSKPYRTYGSGVHVSEWGDSYDGSRVLLTDAIRALPLRGAPVALVADRSLLLVCGDGDEQALREMFALSNFARDTYRRPISNVPIRLSCAGWETFRLPPGHPLHDELQLRRLCDEIEVYNRQREMLPTATHYPVATCHMAQSTVSGEYATISVWVAGVDSLLPETGRISVIVPSLADKTLRVEAMRIPWAQAVGVLQEHVVPAGHYPPRFLFRGVPGPAQMAALRRLEGFGNWDTPATDDERVVRDD